MNRQETLALAMTKPKKDWAVYSHMKNLLDEILADKEYEQFIKDLTDILEL